MPPSDDPEVRVEVDNSIEELLRRFYAIINEIRSSGMYVGSLFDEPLPSSIF
jgi:hypothetical protein